VPPGGRRRPAAARPGPERGAGLRPSRAPGLATGQVRAHLPGALGAGV